LRDLRDGKFDVLVGINLLREGLDLPEVSLVAILDADKEGFLRSRTALIQTFGRAARNLRGHVILYADRITKSMQAAIDETDRRREIQVEYNRKNNITPRSTTSSGTQYVTDRVEKPEDKATIRMVQADYVDMAGLLDDAKVSGLSVAQRRKRMQQLENDMRKAAKDLDFEKAASLRDEMLKLREMDLKLSASGLVAGGEES